MASRERDELFAAVHEKRIVGDEQRAVPLLDEAGEGGINITFGAGVQDMNLLPDGASCGLHVSQLRFGFRATRVDENGDHRGGGHQLTEQSQPLSRQLRCQQVQAGGIASRPVKARDEAEFDRVVGTEEDDWNCRGCRLRGECRGGAGRNDHGHPTLDQIGR